MVSKQHKRTNCSSELSDSKVVSRGRGGWSVKSYVLGIPKDQPLELKSILGQFYHKVRTKQISSSNACGEVFSLITAGGVSEMTEAILDLLSLLYPGG